MMNYDRIHACLDGELPPEALTHSEHEQFLILQSAIGDAVTVLRSTPVPDLTASVMAALPARESAPSVASRLLERTTRSLAWLWEPRMVSFRPGYALAGVASVALAVVSIPREIPRDPEPVAIAAPTQQLYVQFRLDAPEGSQVRLAGSFTEWQPEYELRESAPGVFTALVPLDPGVHDYTFVIDGEEWVADPAAPQVADSFGGRNSRLFLPRPEVSSSS